MTRLSKAGFKREFVRFAVLPDWWDETSVRDPAVLADIEFRVARFLGASLSDVRDPRTELKPPRYPEAQLRRVRGVDRERLVPAIHSALRIAAAVCRSLRDSRPASAPPSDPLRWRSEILGSATKVTLESTAEDLWRRGIPVVPLEIFPSPSFQGIACVAEDRPAILLGHRHDDPGRVSLLVAHEAGHVAAGDVGLNRPIVDEEEAIADADAMEVSADRYAVRFVVGSDSLPMLEGHGFRELASAAAKAERETGADASALIYAWAARTGDFAAAAMAVKALYRGMGARKVLRRLFDAHVDLEAASETDRSLLRCVFGEPALDAAAD